MLHKFVTVNREEIITRCKGKVTTRSNPTSTKGEANHGVPMFLNQLVDALQLGTSSASPAIGNTATQHGDDRLRQGFTVSQVVLDYGDVCQAITEIAVEQNAAISTTDFRILNACLDDAIASAVTEYGRERHPSMDGRAAGSSVAVAILARELRASIQRVTIAVGVIQTGSVGFAGSTGNVLNENLITANELIDCLLAEVAVPTGTTPPVVTASNVGPSSSTRSTKSHA